MSSRMSIVGDSVSSSQETDIFDGASQVSSGSEISVPAEISAPEEFAVTSDTDVRRGNPARHWVFTIHSESTDDPVVNAMRQAWRPPNIRGKIRYLVCQQEIGGVTGRAHWQGYVQFTSPVRCTQVRAELNCVWAWVKPARGTPQQARAYCTKEDTRAPGTEPVEYGTFVEVQGKRNDLHDVFDMLRDGASMVSVLEAQPASFMRYQRGIQAASHLLRTREASTKLRDVEVIVVWGPPGSGKTRWVWETYGGGSMYTLSLSGSTVWWDGYDGQETVLMDDYAGQIPYRTLLTYLDRYPVQCPVKGSMVWLSATRIILTSNLHWSDWYQQDTQGRRDPSALQRRIGQVRHVPAWGAVHSVQLRGVDPTDSATWVPSNVPSAIAPGFIPPHTRI